MTQNPKALTATIGTALVATLLAVWVFAPVDLAPRWAAVGTSKAAVGFSPPNQMFSTHSGPVCISDSDCPRIEGIPENFMADLVGMRVTDARTKVAALEAIGNGQTLIVRHNNFWPRATDAAFIENRISVDVVLGRVIRAAAKG